MHYVLYFKNLLQKAQSYKNIVIIVQEFDKHLDAHMRERMQYYRNRAHARSHPDKAMSVIVDGMTQKTTEIPYFPSGAPKKHPNSALWTSCLRYIGSRQNT